MKKRHILFLLISIIVLITFVAPSLILRIRFEKASNNYIASINCVDFLKLFDSSEHKEVMSAFKDSGVTVASVREENSAFNTDTLKTVYDAGLDIALFVDGSSEKDGRYLNDIENIISEYGVKYICIENSNSEIEVDIPFEKLISDFNMVLILKETKSQLSNERTKNYDSLTYAAEGRLIRCSETRKDPLEYIDTKNTDFDYTDILYHQMINSVRERNTGFILINPIESFEDSKETLKVTSEATELFCNTLNKSGYSNEPYQDFNDYVPNRNAACGGVAFICVMMTLAIINILRKRSSALLDWSAFVIAVLAVPASFVLPKSLLMLYPALYALIAPCFIISLVITHYKKGSMSLFLGLSAIGMLFALTVSGGILSALLSGFDYYFNSLIFRGVKITLIVPILYAVCAFPFIYFEKGFVKRAYDELKSKRLSDLFKECVSKLRLRHILLIAVVGVVAILYVVRSGNHAISPSEVSLRNTLADLFIARPRTKEFLIGWPAFILWMYFGCFKSNVFIKWITVAGSGLLAASATNTFCHVFTDFSISLLRTVNGFILSLPIVIILFLIIFISKKIRRMTCTVKDSNFKRLND